MAATLVEREMLYCPKCNDTYQDGTQRFCSNDGSRLVSSNATAKTAPNSTGVFTSLLGRASSHNEKDEKLVPKPNYTKSESLNQPPTFHTTFSSKVFKDEDLAVKKDEQPVQTAKPPVVRLVKPSEIASGTAEIGDRKAHPSGRLALTWDNPDVLLGQTVKGRYYVVEQLSQDETSISYLAEDKIIANKQAVVRILMDEKNDTFLSKIFAEERVSLSHINHPNVVSVLDSGELLEGLPFVVTEAVDGFSLKEKMTKLEQFNPLRTARIIRQASYALSEVHQNGILHRSLNPSNIFLTVSEAGTELVKVTDFVVSNGAKKQNLEKIKYLAPEQLEGKMPNYASDIYSLAVIAYQMLTGKIPFNFGTSEQLLRAQKEGTFILPSKFRNDISNNVDEVFEKALAYNPAERYPKARDFGDALFNSLSLAPASQKIEIEGVGLKEEKKITLPSSSVLIPTAKDTKPFAESEPIQIEANDEETEQDEIVKANITDGEMAWEKRSPEPINTGSSLWLILLGVGVLVLTFLAYLSWNYFRNREVAPEFVANNTEISAQGAETPVTEIKSPSQNQGEIESPPLPRSVNQPKDTEYFENSKMNSKGDLAKNYRGFKLFYPKTWTKNPSATNFLDISRKDENGDLIEQMIVTYYNSTGLFSKDKELFPKLVEKSNKDLNAALGDNFKVVSQGETKIQNGRWSVYEVKFQSSGEKDGKTITIWGRRFWLPTQNPTMRNGFVITMLATSFSSDVKGVDDVGNKEDLATILETFEPSTLD